MRSIDDAIQVVDINGRILGTTDRGKHLLLADGTPPTYGNVWLHIWSGSQRAAAERAFGEALAGKTGTFAGWARVDSGMAWMEVVLTRMSGGAETPFEILVISRDASVRHDAEIGIESSEEHHRRFLLALQTASLRAALPIIGRMEISSYYRPSSDTLTIGGDWYDAIPLDDGKVLFSIGDIVGDGLDAAVAMTRIKQTMETAGLLTGDPAAMLKIANETVCRIGDDLFATALAGVFDAERRSLIVATAGHPPPVICEENETYECILEAAPPLGVFRTLDAPSRQLKIATRAMIVTYTDGLVESERDPVGGFERLMNVAMHRDSLLHSAQPAAEIAGAVLEESLPCDDVAVLVLRELESPA